MPDGRTPTLTIVGAGNTVVLTEISAPYPFPGQSIAREYQERNTRSTLSASLKVRVFRPWDGSEESLSFSATVDRTTSNALRAMARANPPAVTVTYVDETWEGVMTAFSPVPEELADENDSMGPLENVITATILRDSE